MLSEKYLVAKLTFLRNQLYGLTNLLQLYDTLTCIETINNKYTAKPSLCKQWEGLEE